MNARDAERRAQTIVSVCVGGMVLARTTNDPGLRKSLRAASRLQALALLEVNQDYGSMSVPASSTARSTGGSRGKWCFRAAS